MKSWKSVGRTGAVCIGLVLAACNGGGGDAGTQGEDAAMFAMDSPTGPVHDVQMTNGDSGVGVDVVRRTDGGMDAALGCVRPAQQCGGRCVEVSSDHANCGGCGRACAMSEVCSGGDCVAACVTPLITCFGQCANTDTDPANCGRCGSPCATGFVCSTGRCTLVCQPPETMCGPMVNDAGVEIADDGGTTQPRFCADLSRDSLNCGACRHRCAVGEVCTDSRCTAMCGPGLTGCDGTCVDLDNNPAHCGRCDQSCVLGATRTGTGVCLAGACTLLCDVNHVDCNHSFADGCEVDVRGDAHNCGACGNECPGLVNGAATCVDRVCRASCLPGYDRVGDACVILAPPQPIGPLATATVATTRPTFRVRLAEATTGAEVEICADRSCTTVAQRLTVSGAPGAIVRTSPAAALAAGEWFWRARSRLVTTSGNLASSTRWFRIGARSAGRDVSYGTRADVDGDGLADVLVADRGAGTLRLFTGHAGGLGASPMPAVTRSYMAGTAQFDVVALGDVDGDGVVDVGVRDGLLGQIQVFRGGSDVLGGSSVAATTLFYTANAADGPPAALGDVDGDGFADVGIVDLVARRVAIYRGSAAGLRVTASDVWTMALTGTETAVTVAAAGDLDGDGLADVAVGVRDGGSVHEVRLFHGSDAGTSITGTVWTRLDVPAGSSPVRLAGALDLDGDGYCDLVVGDVGASLRVYAGGAAGPSTTFATPLGGTHDASIALVAAGDADGDGFDDLVVADSTRGGLLLGGATVREGGALTPTGAVFIAGSPGDTNGDGRSDVVFADRTARTLSVYAGAASGFSIAAASTSTIALSAGTLAPSIALRHRASGHPVSKE